MTLPSFKSLFLVFPVGGKRENSLTPNGLTVRGRSHRDSGPAHSGLDLGAGLGRLERRAPPPLPAPILTNPP